jgi:hypothetical protein
MIAKKQLHTVFQDAMYVKKVASIRAYCVNKKHFLLFQYFNGGIFLGDESIEKSDKLRLMTF